MSWLRRIFGGSAGRSEDTSSAPAASAGKDVLLELLRARGARSALVAYDGGNDEGGVASIAVSSEPLGEPIEHWQDTALPGGEDVLWGDWSEHGAASYGTRPDADERLLEAAEAVVCEKWGSFAGEFEVEGRLVVDVDAGAVARQDVAWITEGGERDGEPDRETELL